MCRASAPLHTYIFAGVCEKLQKFRKIFADFTEKCISKQFTITNDAEIYPKFYLPSLSASTRSFYGPQKFLAVKPKKQVISDVKDVPVTFETEIDKSVIFSRGFFY